MLTRKPLDEASCTYNNRVLVHNWWEDRLATTGTQLSTTDRIMALDVGSIPAPPAELATTKRADDHARMHTPLPAAVKPPSMYNEANLQAQLDAYGTPESLVYTLGQSHTGEPSKDQERHFETTNNHFYAALPLAATTSKPEYFAAGDRTHHKTAAILRDTLDPTKESDVNSRGGFRGEITRNPRESGNPYGVSVFVDEYAKWQTKLDGMPLEESVRRAQSKYF